MAYTWRIWYDDGSSFVGNSAKEWEDLPRHGVLIVKELRPKTSDLIHMGLDYYWFEECLDRPNCGQVKSCNSRDLDRYLERPRGLKCVKFGRWGDDIVWAKVQEEAREYKGG